MAERAIGRTGGRARTSLGLVLTSLALLAPDAAAQGGPRPTGTGWPAPTVGVRGGYDYNATGSVVGAQIRVAALPSGYLQLVPNGEITFLTGLREYQAGLDLVGVSGGRRGGIYAGAGIAWRNTLYEGPDRETRLAPTVVVGILTSSLGGAPFGTQIEMRWSYPEGEFRPRVLSLGVNFRLGGRERR